MIVRLTLLFVGCAAWALAQTSPPETLTLDRALELAVQSHPEVAASNARISIADAAILTAKARPNPEVNIVAGRQHATKPSNITGQLEHYGVAQLIELPSIRRARLAAAQTGKETTEFSRANSRLSVVANVKQTFFEYLRRKGEVELSRQTMRLLEDLRRRIQVQVDVGEAARLELTRADAELATSRTQVRSAELRQLTALAALRAAIGAPLPEQVEPKAELHPRLALPSLDEVKREVLAKHPLLNEADSEIRYAEKILTSEKALRKPQPVLLSEFEEQPDLRYYRFGVALPLPLWNRRQGTIAEAGARITHAKAAKELRRLEISSALEQAYGEYQVASEQVASYETGVLREAEAALTAAQTAYRLGERGIIEVLDAQRVLRGAKVDYLNAQYDREAALIELERLRTESFGGVK